MLAKVEMGASGYLCCCSKVHIWKMVIFSCEDALNFHVNVVLHLQSRNSVWYASECCLFIALARFVIREL